MSVAILKSDETDFNTETVEESKTILHNGQVINSTRSDYPECAPNTKPAEIYRI